MTIIDSSNATVKDEQIVAVANKAHDVWRSETHQPFSKPTFLNVYRPSIKDDGNGGLVDIANTPFVELPTKWKEENLAAASFALQFLTQNPSVDVDTAAAAMYDDYLTRRGLVGGSNSYDGLSPEQKDNERLVVLCNVSVMPGAGTF